SAALPFIRVGGGVPQKIGAGAIPRGGCRRGKGWGGLAAPGRGPPPAQAPPGQSRAAAPRVTTSPSEPAMFSVRTHPPPPRSNSRRARPRLEVLEDRATPALLVVNTLAGDHNDGQLSLPEAIEAVNSGSLSGLSAAEQMQVFTAQDPLGTNDTIQI